MKTAIYVRVSTNDQTTENQLPDLEALASRRGFEIVATFCENVSAVKRRPEFDKMIAAGHRGKFDVLLVWSLDRLHRSMVGALRTVFDLDRRGVQVVCYKEPWLDTGGPRTRPPRGPADRGHVDVGPWEDDGCRWGRSTGLFGVFKAFKKGRIAEGSMGGIGPSDRRCF